MRFVAVIGDIINSKKITKRMEFQENLQNIFSDINLNNNSIISPYTITLGDEFQAVYSDIDHIFHDIWKIFREIYPYKIRISIGIDELSTKINHTSSIGMDGPAFHQARQGIEVLKKQKNNVIQIYSADYFYMNIINNSLYLISGIISKWNHHTIDIIRFLIEGKSMDEIKDLIKISKRGIYKNIKNNNINYIISLQNEIIKIISKDLL
jgi:hypothetical protein